MMRYSKECFNIDGDNFYWSWYNPKAVYKNILSEIRISRKLHLAIL